MSKEKKITSEGFNEILLYTTPNGKVKVEIYLRDETIWLTQQKIADLFGVDRTVVTKHLQNIFNEGELKREATCANIAQVQQEGTRKVTRSIEFYNLDWVEKLDAFLQFNEEAILKDAGKVSHEVALALAEKEFEKYSLIEDSLFESDFDKEVKKIQTKIKELGDVRKKSKGKNIGKGR